MSNSADAQRRGLRKSDGNASKTGWEERNKGAKIIAADYTPTSSLITYGKRQTLTGNIPECGPTGKHLHVPQF